METLSRRALSPEETHMNTYKFYKLIVFGFLVFNSSCGKVDGKLFRPINKSDLGSTNPIPTPTPTPPPVVSKADTWGYWGSSTDLAKTGNYILSGGTRGLQVFDYSSPDNPVLVNSILNTAVKYISVYQTFAFLSYDSGKFEILDISNPAGPSLLAEHTFTGPLRAQAANGYVYVPDYTSGVRIIKLDEPTTLANTLVVKSNAGIAAGRATAVAIANGYLFVTDSWYEQLSYFDLVDPVSPVKKAEATASYEPWDIKIKGDYIYIAVPWTGIDVFKFAPGTATPLTQGAGYYDPNWTYQTEFFNIQIEGSHLYALSAGNSAYDALISFDIVTDPETPTPVSMAHHGDTYYNGQNFIIADNKAYMAYTTSGIHTIDTSNPNQLSVPYRLQGPGWWIYAVETKGTYAYACDSNWGLLKLIDISNPVKPVALSLPDIDCNKDLLVDGNYLYVSTGNVDIYDISTPANPIFLKSVAITSARGQYLSKSGNNLVVTSSSGYYPHIVNVADPANAVVVSTNAAGSTVQSHVVVDGNYAYFAGSGSLKIMNITNPAAPVAAGSLSIKYQGIDVITGSRIAKAGNHVYIYGSATSSKRAFYVVDVTDPASPQLVKSLEGLNSAASMAIAGDKLYYCQYDVGLFEFDISIPASTSLTNVFHTGACLDVHYANGLLYSADESTGLRILDLTKPESLGVRAEDHRGGGTAIQLVGDHSFLQNGYMGVAILDMTTPLQPKFVNSVKTTANADAFMVHNDLIYIGDDFRLMTYDISDKDVPTLLSTMPKQGLNFAGFAVNGNYMYSAEGDLVIYDISTPGSPTFVRKIAGMAGMSVTVSGDHLFAADSSDGVRIYDIGTAPDNPGLLATYKTPDAYNYYNQAWDVVVDGDYMYVAYLQKGVEVVDISTIGTPVRTALYNTPGEARTLRKQGDLIFVADYSGGLHILDVSAPGSPSLKRTITPTEARGNIANLEISGTHLHVTTYEGNYEIFDISDIDNIHQ